MPGHDPGAMTAFLHDDFLLESAPARQLYHDHASRMPIIDYHCHLPAEDIARDRRFDTITAAWLEGDHYKWRAMRINGVPERYCTGAATDWEKFEKWAQTVPYTVLNPLYHWTHMELRRPFGIETILAPGSARSVFDRCNDLLREDDFSVRGILRQMDVRLVCTTNDPCETLWEHDQLRDFDIRVLPGFRADRASAILHPESYNAYVDTLADAAGVDISGPSALMDALERRHAYFDERGCCVSDHGEEVLYAEPYSKREIEDIFSAVRKGRIPSAHDVAVFKSWILHELALLDHARGWVQQFHLGALRNTNTWGAREVGRDSGFDSIGDFAIATDLARFLDRLDQTDSLAPTILYSVNPAHNEVLATMAGNFCRGSKPGKVQFGTAWWFLDQEDGMRRQLTALANMGLLSRFVGMLTDSRSFLSFPRHEYFRRILCGMIGAEVERGSLPSEMDWLGQVVEGICFNNALEYFGFSV